MDDVHFRGTYDLPAGYDIDRIILVARDPHCLYTYWEISNDRIQSFYTEFGHELWEKSVPALKVINVTKNTSFYITTNDLANNWYINVGESGCIYLVEIGRRISDKFFISLETSNYVLTPCDNLCTNTTAYFADYREIRKGNLEASEIYATYSLNSYYRGAFGVSSLELFGMGMHESKFGPSSGEFFGFGMQNYF